MYKENIKLCVFPMTIVWGNIKANLNNLEKSLGRLNPETDILVLPETFSTGFPTNIEPVELVKLIDDNSNKVIEAIQSLSARFNVSIAGSVIATENGKFYNRAFFIKPDGCAVYADKKHLFSMAGESKIFTSGHHRLSVEYLGWNIAMVVCYDIRFPVWCRNRKNEYDLLLAVANWPTVRINAWERLLPARAIENEAYVVGVNCTGVDKQGYEYNGSSMILDYKGEKIGYGEGDFIYADLPLEKLRRFREKFPVWQDADVFSMNDI